MLRFEGLESASSLLCGYCGDMKRTVTPGAKLKIAASCFSIYAYEALKAELKQVESVEIHLHLADPRARPGDCQAAKGKARVLHPQAQHPQMHRADLQGPQPAHRTQDAVKANFRHVAKAEKLQLVFPIGPGHLHLKFVKNQGLYETSV